VQRACILSSLPFLLLTAITVLLETNFTNIFNVLGSSFEDKISNSVVTEFPSKVLGQPTNSMMTKPTIPLPLVTKTVLGFAQSMTTVGNTVMVFMPGDPGKDQRNDLWIDNDTLAGDDESAEQKMTDSIFPSIQLESTARLGLEDLFDFTLSSPVPVIQPLPSYRAEIQPRPLLEIESIIVTDMQSNSLVYIKQSQSISEIDSRNVFETASSNKIDIKILKESLPILKKV
jgi:hypothetical protein